MDLRAKCEAKNMSNFYILRSVWKDSRWYVMKQRLCWGTWMSPFSFQINLLQMLHFSPTSFYSLKIQQISLSESDIRMRAVQSACSVCVCSAPYCWALSMSAAHMPKYINGLDIVTVILTQGKRCEKKLTPFPVSVSFGRSRWERHSWYQGGGGEMKPTLLGFVVVRLCRVVGATVSQGDAGPGS